MGIVDRYAGAVRSSDLKSEERTTHSDSDVLGAMGVADRRLTHDRNPRWQSPLSVPLLRLFMGDNHAASQIVAILADMAWRKARQLEVRMTVLQSEDLARACLAWHRDGTCKPCGGHGVLKIPGTSVLGDRDCGVCKGTGRIPFERAIHPPEFRPVAGWLESEMTRASSKAGTEAMNALAPKLDL